jgi:hypothetical protein
MLEWKEKGVVALVDQKEVQKGIDFGEEGAATKSYPTRSGTPPPPPSAREQKRPKKQSTPKKDNSIIGSAGSMEEHHREQ